LRSTAVRGAGGEGRESDQPLALSVGELAMHPGRVGSDDQPVHGRGQLGAHGLLVLVVVERGVGLLAGLDVG
jgi:hypothetical protein